MKFDSSTRHQDVYLSTDCMTLTDRYEPNIQQLQPGMNPLYTYRGVIVDNCIPTDKTVYFEINYDYTIVSQTVLNSVFEIGLAERAKVYKGVYVGMTEIGGWAFAISRCQAYYSRICLEAWHLFVRKFSVAWSLNQIGQRTTGTFKIIVNRKDESYSLYNSSTLFHMFTNVQSDVQLCPVFSVHGSTPKGFTSTLSLSNVHTI